jgi:hypothetical protein
MTIPSITKVTGRALAGMLFLVVLLSIIVPVPTHAAASINITDTSVQISFPGSLAFNFQAQSTSPIKDVRVHYQVDRLNFAVVTSEAWPKPAPATTIKTRWVWDMRKYNLPPGTTLKYWWTASNQTGESVTSNQQKIVFEDTRYSWNKINNGNINLMWYQGSQQFAYDLLNAGGAGLRQLETDTGVRLDRNVRIYIYASSRDLLGALVFPREWTGGAAFSEYGSIVLGVSTSQLAWGKRAISHELGHLVVHQLTYGPYGSSVPTWLDEGLVQHAEGAADLAQQAVLLKAIKEGKTISLRSLASPFSAVSDEAVLSYAESYAVVDYLIKAYGKEKVVSLLKSIGSGSTADQALTEIYRMDQDGLYSSWLKSVGTNGSAGKTV